jgi:HAD superfamily hydrolase (TIGR01459 family)
MSKIFKPVDIIDDYDLFLVDIWGVIYEGSYIYPGVVESLSWMAEQKPLCFVSNSPRLKQGVKARLESFGIDANEDMIYSSGAVAALMIEESEKYLGIKNPSIYELTDDYFKAIYSSTGWNFTTDIKQANILLVTAQMKEGDDLTQHDLIMAEAAKLGLVCICPNPDTIIPDGNSKTYCPGFIVRNYTGKLVYTGKPHPYIYEPVLDKYQHIPKERILMIGDSVDMDILGAQNVGIKSALVPTGNAKLLREKIGLAENDFTSIRKHIDVKPSILLDLTCNRR